MPFGNGWRCIGGSLRRVLPPLVSDPSGRVSFTVDLTKFPFSGSAQAILPGSCGNFQYWYHDPAGTPSSFNLSDAWHLVFAP